MNYLFGLLDHHKFILGERKARTIFAIPPQFNISKGRYSGRYAYWLAPTGLNLFFSHSDINFRIKNSLFRFFRKLGVFINIFLFIYSGSATSKQAYA